MSALSVYTLARRGHQTPGWVVVRTPVVAGTSARAEPSLLITEPSFHSHFLF